jgi:AraC-like DNA-binding protein
MTDATMADPERMRMWARLAAIADHGLAGVHAWGLADGCEPGAAPPAHQHTVATMVLCLSGVVRVVGRRALDLKPGEMLVIAPGCWHDHIAHRPGSTACGLGLLAGKSDVLFFDHQQVLWGAVPAEPYQGLLLGLLAGGEAERLRLADELLTGLVRERIHYVDWSEPSVLRMAAHLWNHLHQPITADDVVAQSQLGRSQSFVRFKDFFGRSPKQELEAQRLALARHLLRARLPVAEVAKRCGFPTRGHFTRSFRRCFATTPSAFADDCR